MNREIEFRAWHEKLGKMLYPPAPYMSFFHIEDKDGNRVEEWEMMPNEKKAQAFKTPATPCSAHMTWDGLYYVNGVHQPMIFLQYTGIRDKTMKKVFEGDLVNVNGVGVGKVIFECGSFILENKQGGTFSDSWRSMLNGEVIGNIYENPEKFT